MLLGCRADLEVVIDVEADGSGEVTVVATFDDEVVAAVPDLDRIVRFDDARAAGWSVDVAPGATELVVTLGKPFASIDQLAPVLMELDGPEGLFEDAVLSTGRRGGEVDYELRVVLALDRHVAELVEPAVGSLLDGEPLGTPVAELEERAGASLDDTVSLVVVARVPGGEARFPATGTVGLADGGRHELVATGRITDEAIAAADRAAADARDDVSNAMTATVVALAAATTLAVAALVVTRPRSRRRRSGARTL